MSPEDADFLSRLVDRDVELRAFIFRLIDPEDFGHAVSVEIRQAACAVLRIPAPHGTVSRTGEAP